MRTVYAATIGFFDGVHRGHQYLMAQLREHATALRLHSMLITFDEHPRRVLHSDFVPGLLSTLDEKVALLRESGVDEVTVLHFTPEMAHMDARQFMQEVLVEQLNVRALLLGYDHQFGHGGGTCEQYCEWGRQTGIQVLFANELQGDRVSSSVIRRLLLQGDVTMAERLLGRPYRLQGMVQGGRQIGRRMGFPTANLLLPASKLLPGSGAYAVRVQLPDGMHRGGMLNIGQRPTVDNGDDVTVEVNVFDFQGNLYGQRMSVELLKHLRAERAFSSMDALREQLAQDEQCARAIVEARND